MFLYIFGLLFIIAWILTPWVASLLTLRYHPDYHSHFNLVIPPRIQKFNWWAVYFEHKLASSEQILCVYYQSLIDFKKNLGYEDSIQWTPNIKHAMRFESKQEAIDIAKMLWEFWPTLEIGVVKVTNVYSKPFLAYWCIDKYIEFALNKTKSLLKLKEKYNAR